MLDGFCCFDAAARSVCQGAQEHIHAVGIIAVHINRVGQMHLFADGARSQSPYAMPHVQLARRHGSSCAITLGHCCGALSACCISFVHAHRTSISHAAKPASPLPDNKTPDVLMTCTCSCFLCQLSSARVTGAARRRHSSCAARLLRR